MKRSTMGVVGAMAIFLAVLIVATPLLAQQVKMEEARIAAEKKAKERISPTLWILAGFLGDGGGVVLSYIHI